MEDPLTLPNEVQDYFGVTFYSGEEDCDLCGQIIAWYLDIRPLKGKSLHICHECAIKIKPIIERLEEARD